MPEVIQIRQTPGPPDEERFDAQEHIILLLPASVAKGRWPRLPYRDLLKKRAARHPRLKCGTVAFTAELPNARGTRATLACLDPDAERFELLTLARKLVAAALQPEPQALAVAAAGLDPELARRGAEAVVSAALAARAEMPQYKSTPPEARRLKSLRLLGLESRLDLGRVRAEAEGNALARELSAMPPNELTPRAYRERVEALAREAGWRCRFHDMAALEKRGAGAFLAVARGSEDREAGIVHLRYTPPRGARRSRLALVGKGICFDTGGYSLKPTRGMIGMQEDMEGSAVALGTLLALTRLKADFPIDCWLALAQNHIGPRAYKPTEVVRALDGTTIEIVNTDAEGRMVLADTLALAAREKPDLILDYATLTGSCVTALGTRYSGAFTNRRTLVPEIIEAGRASGERVWPFPTDADYDEELESKVADTKQCPVGGEADHIYAARFLARFVPEAVPWVHVDLAAGHHEGGLGHVPTDATGFGVGFTLALLYDRGVASRLDGENR
ncbi:MAG: leucyl aminopeptidase family protein [Gammaproteobacteria bacterium]|nr:leucyl aminopeptidase family protein [Gammaproteobacteria bacterium]